MKIKNYLLIGLMLLTTASLTLSCDKEQEPELIPELSVTKTDGTIMASLTLQATAQINQQFVVVSNVSWTITPDAATDWIEISPTSFNNDQSKEISTTVTINVSANPTTSPRTGHLTIAYSDQNVDIAVTQTGADAPTLTVTPETLSWAAASTDEKTVSVAATLLGVASTEWTATCDATDKFEITIDKPNGQIKVQPLSTNPTESAATATLEVAIGGITKVVALSQEGAAAPTLNVTPTTLDWAADSTEEKTITVTATQYGSATTAWTATVDNTKFTLTVDKANGIVKVNPVAANADETDVTAKVSIELGNIKKEVALTQAGAEPAPQEQKIYSTNFEQEGLSLAEADMPMADTVNVYTANAVDWSCIYGGVMNSTATNNIINETAFIRLSIPKNVECVITSATSTLPTATTANVATASTQLTRIKYNYKCISNYLFYKSEYSLDGGTTWVTVDAPTTALTNDKKNFVTIDQAIEGATASSDIRLRFVLWSGPDGDNLYVRTSNRFVHFDDVEIYGIVK